ncbi:hypothetical protein [Paenibacillus sp. 8b26]|uniref:hypothetical protein n=1 Tax=Paenibacillus sp. 8b26 TaxID=3424133 RepID=UPI003D65A4C6
MNMVALSTEDKIIFENFITESSRSPEKAEVILKVFHNIAVRFNALPANLESEITEIIQFGRVGDENLDILTKGLKDISASILTLAEEEISPSYSTGQLAKMFGVSISTINNWIAAKRFVGFVREEKNKQARINARTLWISPTGEHISLKEVATLYKENQTKLNMDKTESQINHIRYSVDMINFYEERYGNSFEHVLKEKGEPSMSNDFKWSREGKEWRASLQEISPN